MAPSLVFSFKILCCFICTKEASLNILLKWSSFFPYFTVTASQQLPLEFIWSHQISCFFLLIGPLISPFPSHLTMSRFFEATATFFHLKNTINWLVSLPLTHCHSAHSCPCMGLYNFGWLPGALLQEHALCCGCTSHASISTSFLTIRS